MMAHVIVARRQEYLLALLGKYEVTVTGGFASLRETINGYEVL